MARRNARFAKVVQATIDIMDDPKKWCQGLWAIDARGVEIDADDDPTCQRLQHCGVSENFAQANSPAARKFCVEGAIYHAAGQEYKRPEKGESVGDTIIAELDQIVSRHGDDFDSGQTLNDDNGDASRVKLVDFLKVLRAELQGT